ncbi:hypothetical protein [Streptomyces sp. NPDC093109]|uniref:hypothetical protein n=1 Tax=Streptomyces sp. NPDC093109 TaxID=3154977 RepID=UPI00344B3767
MRSITDIGAPSRIWRPYIDPPLITQEMVQEPAAAVGGPDQKRLLRYLGEFVAGRAAPVHTAVAFNAVYFGFDTETGGYAGGPLDIGEFPSVALGDRVEALPVGAMINVRTGGDLLPAEVVYKEGAHPALGGEGDTPGWISGAPAEARGPGELAEAETSVLRERLVFDDTAFGQGLAATRERLNRLRRRGRIDEYGHLLVESQYVSSDSGLDDAAYYARYLMTRGRSQLTSSLAPIPLPLLLPAGSDHEVMGMALLTLMRAVRTALGSLPSVRMWGDYAFTRDSMVDRLADPGPLGGAALETLAQSVVRSAVPSGRRRPVGGKRVAYTALGPALRSLPGEPGSLRTTAYPLAICHANTLLADYVRGERDDTTGRLSNGVWLAVDDRWQGGGLWRAEYGNGDFSAGDAVGHRDESSGRGWRESLLPDAASIPAPSPRPSNSPDGSTRDDGPSGGACADDADGADDDGLWWPDDGELDVPRWQSVTGERIEWAQPLRAWQVRDGIVPLPEEVSADAALRGAADTVRLLLSHDGRESAAGPFRHNARFEPRRGCLVGLSWPADFFPGIWLSLSWRRGSRVVHARTTRLPQPETVDGRLIEHRYDRRVLTRDDGEGPSTTAFLRDGEYGVEWLVMTAVRRLGLLDVYGRAMLPRDRVGPAVRLVMPDEPRNTAPSEVAAALDRLLAAGRLTLERGSRGVDGRPSHPARSGEPALELVCYTPLVLSIRPYTPDYQEPAVDSGRVIKGHHVPGFLRYIGHLGYEASAEQRRLFREDFLAFGLAGTPEIPAGYTYVRPHRRGVED